MTAGARLRGMRVLLAAEYYASGGTRTYLRTLLDFYARHEALVTLVPTWDGRDDTLLDDMRQIGVRHLSYRDLVDRYADVELAAPPLWRYAEALAERRAFAAAAADLDVDRIVVSAGTPGLLLGAAGALAGGRYILHTYPHGRRQHLKGRVVMGRLARGSMRVVAVSQFEQRRIRALWGPAESSVVYNTAGPVEESTRGQREPVVLTVSWVEDYKDPATWIRAAEVVTSRRPDLGATFVWLGEGRELTAARTMAQRSAASSAIEFAGHEDNPGKAYRRAAVYLQPSRVENMSLSVLDAQRHGVPIVATRVGGLPEIVADGRFGLLVPPGDADAMALAVIGVLDDPHGTAAMTLGGLDRYRKCFSPDVWDDAMLRLHLDA